MSCKDQTCQAKNTLIAVISAGVTMGLANFAANRLRDVEALSSVREYVKPAVSAGVAFLGLRMIPSVPVKTGVVIGSGVLGMVSGASAIGFKQIGDYVPVLAGEPDNKIRIPVSTPQEAMQAFAAMYPDAARQLADPRRSGIEGAYERNVPTLSGEPENLLTTEHDTLG